MSNQQQQAGVELSDEVAAAAREAYFGKSRHGEINFSKLDPDAREAWRRVAHATIVAADRQQRGKVEPVAQIGYPAGYTTSPIKWAHRQSECVVKITRERQEVHGFVHPLFTHPQAEKAPSPSVIRESRTTEFDGAPSVQAVKCCYGGMKPAGACGDCAGARPAAAPQQPSVPDAAIASEQEKGKS